jgi:hypothetical protein
VNGVPEHGGGTAETLLAAQTVEADAATALESAAADTTAARAHETNLQQQTQEPGSPAAATKANHSNATSTVPSDLDTTAAAGKVAALAVVEKAAAASLSLAWGVRKKEDKE